MSKDDKDWKTKAAVAAGAAVGSAAIAAALLYARKRKAKSAKDAGDTPFYPPETD